MQCLGPTFGVGDESPPWACEVGGGESQVLKMFTPHVLKRFYSWGEVRRAWGRKVTCRDHWFGEARKVLDPSSDDSEPDFAEGLEDFFGIFKGC